MTTGHLRSLPGADRWVTHPVIKAVGTICERRAQHLIGVASDGQRVWGACERNGQIYVFDFWFPHLALAVDEHEGEHTRECERLTLHEREEGITDPNCEACAELIHKQAWCTERGILYVPPGLPPGELTILAETRREARQ